VAARQSTELWLDTRAVHLFDADSGRSLTRHRTDEADDEIDLRGREHTEPAAPVG
jgi:hypothetical protein